jgi:RimJ/RimL family protein N-acetyltransferase
LHRSDCRKFCCRTNTSRWNRCNSITLPRSKRLLPTVRCGICALEGQAAGTMLPFAIREKSSGVIAGSTRYYDVVAELPRLAIGYTWYAKRWQKSHLNTACKRLLFRHAFESLDCVAVELHTDSRNLDSQRAIERLGARREGVLRAHKRRPDGTLRDTVCYSVLATEWPDVDRWLGMRLERLVTSTNASVKAGD